MANILLDAHGSWSPSSVPPYAMVPKGSRVLFFTENMKLFVGSLDQKANLPNVQPSQTVDSQKMVQNYSVSPFNAGGTVNVVGFEYMTPPANILFCTSEQCANDGWHNPANCQGLFADSKFEGVDIYFMACRFVNLKPVGNLDYYLDTGVNQVQAGLGDDNDEATVDFKLDPDQATPLSNELIAKLLDDPNDFAAVDATEKQRIYDAIVAAAHDDKEKKVAEAMVWDMQLRYP